ncbi:MAG: PEGA domain-containing protein [Polyangiaceae bacterium]
MTSWARRRMVVGWQSLLLLLGILSTPATAAADDRSEARALVQKGNQRFKASDFAEALELFRRADEKFHSAAIRYNIAQAQEKLGNAEAALEAYRAYLNEDGAAGKFAAAAKTAIEEIRERSAEVAVDSTPAGARIMVNGVELEAKTPAVVAMFPGSHSVEVVVGDFRQTKSLDVPAPRQRLKLAFASGSRAAPPLAEPDADRSPPKPARTTPGKPDDFVFGGGIAVMPFTFLGAKQHTVTGRYGSVVEEPSQPSGVMLGLAVDVGLTPVPGDLVFLFRAVGGLGVSSSDNASVGGDEVGFAFFAGPGFGYRAARRVQVGASLAIGASKFNGPADGRYRSDTCTTCSPEPISASDETNLAYGLMGEVSYAFITTPSGEWYGSVLPTLLKATDEGVGGFLAFPVTVGYRLY